MAADLRLESGTYGPRAVILGPWSSDLTRSLIAHRVAELELNYAKGWRGNDLSFLSALSFLKAFTITDLLIEDISPVHSLRDLKMLGVTTYCHTAIDFGVFRHLEDCGLEWRKGCESLFTRSTLRELFVNRYNGKDATPFGKLTGLESLAILSAPFASLEGLAPLKGLRRLRLGLLQRLKSLSGIEELHELTDLEIDTCRKIESVAALRDLRNLRTLFLTNDGTIESLSPLAGLTKLEKLIFPESTNVLDGDLVPLLRLESLKEVAFQNRRHYSHRREDLAMLLQRRGCLS